MLIVLKKKWTIINLILVFLIGIFCFLNFYKQRIVFDCAYGSVPEKLLELMSTRILAIQRPISCAFIFNDFSTADQIEVVDKVKTKKLMLFFNPSSTTHKEVAVYTQVLFNRFKKYGLQVVGVVDCDEKIVEDFMKRAKIDFAIIRDCSKDILSSFNICIECSGIVLLDDKESIIFKENRLLDKENLRQLIEKEMTGEIKYNFSATRNMVFVKNGKYPNMVLINPISNEKYCLKEIKEDYLVMTFFSSVCSYCKSGKRIDNLIRIDNEFSKENLKYRILVIFPQPTEMADIQFWEQRKKIPFEKFISEDIFSNEEKYITSDSYKTDPFTVVLNKHRKALFVEEIGSSEKEIFDDLVKIVIENKDIK